VHCVTVVADDDITGTYVCICDDDVCVCTAITQLGLSCPFGYVNRQSV